MSVEEIHILPKRRLQVLAYASIFSNYAFHIVMHFPLYLRARCWHGGVARPQQRPKLCLLYQALAKISMSHGLGVTTPFRMDQVLKDVYLPPRDTFAQEPIFVPRPGACDEDDGWVLSVMYCSSSGTTDLAILDARQLARGPVALIHLPHHIPHGKQQPPCWLLHYKKTPISCC